MPESLSGLVERVTFHQEDTGFVVLKVQVRGQRDLVTVVGSLAEAHPGEWIHAEGHWIQDRNFGRQFKAERLTSTPPTTREGMEKYLGSGLVKGVGPTYARKLVERFGETVFEVIDTASARLEEIDGIGPKRRRRIKEAWTEQKAVREIMLFLHSHGVGTSRAVRIHKTYGDRAMETVRADPYALARDIAGIGFQTADRIARQIGIPADAEARLRAGLDHALLEATGEGHCALPVEVLVEAVTRLLDVPETRVSATLEAALGRGEVVREQVDSEDLVFLPHLHRAEEGIASRLRAMAGEVPGYPAIDLPRALAWCQERTGCVLAPSQQAALGEALRHRVLVLTGGPGVGKTTLLNTLLMMLRAKKVTCQLAAPTGRAAKRLAEATGWEAKTLHRLLEVDPRTGRFLRNEKHPLETDLLVIDEVSMVDISLMYQVLRAVSAGTSLLLVGDVDQLPSVGPGMVLRQVMDSGVVPVTRLTEVFRQAADSRIVTTAHRIRRGEMPEPGPVGADADFHRVTRDGPEAMRSLLVEMVQRRIPARFGLDPVADIQVLCPMNRGSLGVRELNTMLQDALNPRRPDQEVVEKFGVQFRVGDKVMQTVNNYDKEVFNGDIGRVASIDGVEREVVVRVDGREVVYDFGELDEVALAYAITVHKAQGSEFPAVVLPLAMQHYLLLQRNLVYTAITRGRRLVVVLEEGRALAMAVRNDRTARRYSGLEWRLRGRPAITGDKD